MVKEVRASHILVKTEEQAKTVLLHLQKGGSFAALAAELSQDPSKKRGGDLGFFGRGRMVRPFENVAFGLEKGQVSQPVKTQFGWHVIKVTDRR
ncbi:MAG: peptidylprolyl isomerase [Candidatus Aenigmarchaeota archaeon]|nr:peptidylprolyl isomerase [Candidatus Aenigmarchaeota archaeon]